MHPDEPISVVEDLDPEPPPKRNVQMWEVVLGLLVLVGVLGFAGWQWVRQSHLQSEYGAGEDAVASRDWQAAETHFAAAAGYLDADKQAQQAAENVATRDKEYGAALAAEKNGDWAATLNAIQQVTGLQPGYKDSARIEQQASTQIFTDAMSGTIALRPNADPPGLYLYGPTGWIWLSQSDESSRVRSQSPNGWIVYDVPGSKAGSAPRSLAQDGGPGGSPLDGRRLMAMSLGSTGKPTELALDPAPYSAFQAVDGGVWALSTVSPFGGNGRFPGGQRRFGPAPLSSGTAALPVDGGAYESYTSSLTATLKLSPAPAGQNDQQTILSFDATGDRYLLLVAPRQDLGPRHPISGTTGLYLGQSGGNLQLLYNQQDRSISSAQFSPDGRYILVHTYNILVNAETILLIDPQSSAPPQVLEEATGQLSANIPGGQLNNQPGFGGRPGFNSINYGLSAMFLQDGPYAGKVVIADYEGRQTGLKVIDLALAWNALIQVNVPSSNRIAWTVRPGSDRTSLLSGQEIAPGGFGPGGTIWTVVLSGDTGASATALVIPAFNYADSSILSGGQLYFSIYQRTQSRAEARSVFTFGLDGLESGGQLVPTTSTQLDQVSGNGGFGFFNLSDFSFGSTLFSYLSNDELHARTYDGSADVTLEQHVTYLYNPALHRDANNALR
jgi:hypothetical protein